MIYVREATRAESLIMGAELQKFGLAPNELTPRGRIVGVIQTDSHRVFALVCRDGALEQYALETLQHIVTAAEADMAKENVR